MNGPHDTSPTGHGDAATVTADEPIRYGTPTARWVLLVTILASSMAFFDSTVVNVALPAIGTEFDAAMSGLQWTVTGYLLTLSALILVGGTLGDRYGRRRVFLIGVAWFAVASLLCGIAPSVPILVAARLLQGVGGALLTPGSLAIIQASFQPGDRARAIGAWSGLSGVSAAIGPFIGGWLIEAVSWRLIFLVNLPLAAVIIWAGVRHVPESYDPTTSGRLDATGSVLGAVGLAGVTYALIEAPERGTRAPLVVTAAVVGVLALIAFVVAEKRRANPMLPLGIFANRQFSGANLATFAVYGALGGVFFLLVVQLQQVLGYSALEAGIAAMPVTVLLLFLSAPAGSLATRIGPRLPMTLGPLTMAAAMLWLATIGDGDGYWLGVFPAVTVFGLGLALTVAPLTATVLAAADARHSGLASGVNNAVARTAQLIAVAVLPAAAGMSGEVYRDPVAFSAGYRTATIIAAVACGIGGLISFATIRNDVLDEGEGAGTPEHDLATA